MKALGCAGGCVVGSERGALSSEPGVGGVKGRGGPETGGAELVACGSFGEGHAGVRGGADDGGAHSDARRGGGEVLVLRFIGGVGGAGVVGFRVDDGRGLGREIFDF